MMKQFYKIIQIFIYILKLILSSLSGNEASKRRLSEIYLDALFTQSRLKQVLPPVPNTDIHIARERVNDLYVHLPQRFTLLSERELYSLISLFCEVNPANVLEIGCFKGGSTYHFLLNSTDATQIYSLDNSFHRMPMTIRNALNDSKRFHMIQMNSSQLNSKGYKDKFDFIFIDASHEYEDVKNDTLKGLEMLREGGMMVWDDYSPGYPGVFRWLNEFKDQGRNVLNIQDTSLAFYRKS